MQHFQSRLQHNSCYHDHPSKKFCPNHSTPPTIATIFADFVLDNPATVSEDEAATGEVEDANAPGDVEAEEKRGGRMSRGRGSRTRRFVSPAKKNRQSTTLQTNDPKRGTYV